MKWTICLKLADSYAHHVLWFYVAFSKIVFAEVRKKFHLLRIQSIRCIMMLLFNCFYCYSSSHCNATIFHVLLLFVSFIFEKNNVRIIQRIVDADKKEK